MSWWLAVARLTGLLTCLGLATTRIGLIVHELVGHGGTALAVGGDVTSVQLFWFAGGWIQYRVAGGQGSLAVALGGIVVETVIGAIMWFAWRRRDDLTGRIARAIGAALIIHAGWYLATGTWHGYGDGVQLHRELGDAKWLVAVPVGVATCVVAYAGARLVLRALGETLPRARIAGVLVAVVIAGGVQLGAALAEVRLRRDPTYAHVMQPERERVIASELARWAEAQHAPPSEDERAARERELERAHRTFPFAWLLGFATLASMIAGAARARTPSVANLTLRLLGVTALVACGSIAAVIAIGAAFH